MVIKILGKGCKYCALLERHVKKALEELGMQASIEKVTDLDTIVHYGVMKTPGLVVDEVVKVSGKVPKVSDIKKILQ